MSFSASRILLLIGMAVIYAAAAMRCPVKGPSGETYDLSSITADSPIRGKVAGPEAKDYIVSFTACGKSTLAERCTKDGAAMCVTNSKDSWMYSVATFETEDDIMMIAELPNQLQLTFENAQDMFVGKMRGVINLNCGDAGPVTATVDITKRPVLVTLTTTHPAGCKGKSGGGGGGGGLSGGWIFIIILLSVSFAYIVVGCLINWKVRGLPLGLQACPQRGFWCALPGLVKDGCAFTVRKTKSCCSGSKGSSANSYDDIGGSNNV